MRLCMASADGETAPALTVGMPLPRPNSSASSQALSLTGECDLGVRGVVRYTPHSRRPPVPTALTATLWDAPQHSETPQPGAGATVLQSWVDLLDQAAGSSACVAGDLESMSEEGGFMLCCRVRILSTNNVRCVWLAPVLDTTMHADSPFNKLKAALHAWGCPVQGSDAPYTRLAEPALKMLLADHRRLAQFIGDVFKLPSVDSPDGIPIPETQLPALAANVVATLARGRWVVVAVVVHSASLT